MRIPPWLSRLWDQWKKRNTPAPVADLADFRAIKLRIRISRCGQEVTSQATITQAQMEFSRIGVRNLTSYQLEAMTKDVLRSAEGSGLLTVQGPPHMTDSFLRSKKREDA